MVGARGEEHLNLIFLKKDAIQLIYDVGDFALLRKEKLVVLVVGNKVG